MGYIGLSTCLRSRRWEETGSSSGLYEPGATGQYVFRKGCGFGDELVSAGAVCVVGGSEVFGSGGKHILIRLFSLR